jgi:hypothetical protein
MKLKPPVIGKETEAPRVPSDREIQEGMLRVQAGVNFSAETLEIMRQQGRAPVEVAQPPDMVTE